MPVPSFHRLGALAGAAGQPIDCQQRFDFSRNEYRMLGHLRQPHQFAEGAPCERPRYEQASLRKAIGTDSAGVKIASYAEPGFAWRQDASLFERCEEGLGSQDIAVSGPGSDDNGVYGDPLCAEPPLLEIDYDLVTFNRRGCNGGRENA